MNKYIGYIVWMVLGFAPFFLHGQIDTTKVKPKPKPYVSPADSMRMIMMDSTWRPPDSLYGNIPSFADSSIVFDTSGLSYSIADSLLEPSIKERPHWQKLIFAGPRPPFDPKVAWQRSMIIPGWGQIYNKGYWKVPIVYGGYVALGYWYNLQNETYQNFRTAYLYRVDNDPATEDLIFAGATDDGVRQARDRARRQRDYAVLYIIGFHLFQVLDAFVDAHLKNFDVSEDLSMNTRPGLIEISNPGGPTQYAVGVSLNFNLGQWSDK